ncbi:reverse transcriptase/maturase family protein [Microgenomates group bacterium]|nr:reverse transcriptase/maturase family protein [Microgenomates group bacterium]
MKNINFAAVVAWDNLYRAYGQAKKGQSNKEPIKEFELGLLTRLTTLSQRLKNHTYRVSPYHIFTITEPKERLIMALPFADRVVQHALCQVILPRMEKHFIDANAANRVKKGTHYAIRMFTQQLTACHRQSSEFWCLKCDIKGFFYNIDHERIKEKLRKLFGYDEELMWLMETIIDSSPEFIDKETGEVKPKGKGLPIGNLTSQFFAILYLSDMDHFIKEQLRVKYYVRYMDDFSLLHHDKEFLQDCRQRIGEFLSEKEKLELNNKTQIFSIRQGVNFLGWHFHVKEDTGKIVRLIRKDSKKRRRRKNKRLVKRYHEAKDPEKKEKLLKTLDQSMASWLGHARHGHTWRLQKRVREEIKAGVANTKIGGCKPNKKVV